MNPYLSTIVCNGPRETHRERGAGLSLRPSFYSGRGTLERDITSEHLKIIYDGIKAHEALGQFPTGAFDAFARMVLRIPAITGTAFIESLIALDGNDYVFDECVLSTTFFAIDPDDGTGSREKSLMAGVFAVFAGPCAETTEQVRLNSVGIKVEFLRRIGREDLREQVWKPKATQQSDGSWFDGERTYYRDPDAPKVEESCGWLEYELGVAAADAKYGRNRGYAQYGGYRVR